MVDLFSGISAAGRCPVGTNITRMNVLYLLHCKNAIIPMCLAIPMRIESIDGYTASCEARGIRREASLFLLQDDRPRVGDYVMVQLGYVMHTVSEADAMASWALYDQILAELDNPAPHG